MEKTHNIKRLILPIAAMMTVLMAACQKEMAEGRLVTLQVRMEDEAKTCIYDHTPYWHDGDQFYINNHESGYAVRADGGNCEIENIQEADHYTAVFPRRIVSGEPDLTSATDLAVDMPRTYQYGEEEGETGIQKFNIPMVGLSDTSATTLQFKNVGGLIKVALTDLPAGEVLDSIVVTHNKASLSGTGTISNIRSASPVLSCTGSKGVSLVFAGGTAYGNGTYYLPVPVIASNSSYAFSISVYVHNTTTLVPKRYARTQGLGGGYISRNSMATVPFAVSQDLAKPFDHYYFMMGADRKVMRSPGVLYHGSYSGNNCYYFNEGQTITYELYTITQNDPSMLFYGNSHLPWSAPIGNVDSYEESAYYWLRSLMEAMVHPTNERCEFASLVSGATGYFTPTGAEWQYLLTHNRIGGASVGDTKGGLVVLPHNFDGADCGFKAGFATDSTGFRNSYTTAQWEYMEAHGAMILPMFGTAVIGKEFEDNGYEFTPIPNTMGVYWLKNTADSCLYVSYNGAGIRSMEDVEGIVAQDHYDYVQKFTDYKMLCNIRLMKEID